MITLYTFGPASGLPDISPFVTKAEMLLKLARLDYQTDSNGFDKAPKGKLPYIVDDGEFIADYTFIRWHLEKKNGIDFDQGLALSLGHSKRCSKTTSIGLCCMRAGSTKKISIAARAFFSSKCRCPCV